MFDLSAALKIASVDIYQRVLEQREARKRYVASDGVFVVILAATTFLLAAPNLILV